MSDSAQGMDLFENLNVDPVIRPPQKNSTYRKIYVNFLNESDVAEYARVINKSITAKTKELWFPPQDESIIKTLFEYDETSFYEEPSTKSRKSQEDNLDVDLFDYEYSPGFYELHWQNMPEFNQPDASAVRKISHYFKDEDEIKAFAKMIKQNITKQTSSIWYPYREKNNVKDLYWISTI